MPTATQTPTAATTGTGTRPKGKPYVGRLLVTLGVILLVMSVIGFAGMILGGIT